MSLRKPPTRFPPLAVLGCFPHGLTGRVSEFRPSTNKTRDTHKGHPGFYVEVAGLSRFACPQSQSSLLALGARSPLVSIDSFASLRLWRRPTGATFGSLTHGLTGRVSESSPRHAKSRIPTRGIRDFVSKWRDSNPRPFGPEPNALPNCATPRCTSR